MQLAIFNEEIENFTKLSGMLGNVTLYIEKTPSSILVLMLRTAEFDLRKRHVRPLLSAWLLS